MGPQSQTFILICLHVPATHLLPFAGFYFRSKMYPDVERVLDAFKRDPNYKKKQQAEGMQQQRMAGGAAGEAARGVCCNCWSLKTWLVLLYPTCWCQVKPSLKHMMSRSLCTAVLTPLSHSQGVVQVLLHHAPHGKSSPRLTAAAVSLLCATAVYCCAVVQATRLATHLAMATRLLLAMASNLAPTRSSRQGTGAGMQQEATRQQQASPTGLALQQQQQQQPAAMGPGRPVSLQQQEGTTRVPRSKGATSLGMRPMQGTTRRAGTSSSSMGMDKHGDVGPAVGCALAAAGYLFGCGFLRGDACFDGRE
jgi:hypothetical protein